jgi:hypothetical protein
VGATIKEGEHGDLAALYSTPPEKWPSLPFVTTRFSAWRTYACKCHTWQESSAHLLVNDRESPGDPNVPWTCGGHPPPVLPVTLENTTITETTDWAATVERILHGARPRALQRDDEGPWLLLIWLYAYLRGLPVASKLSTAVANRVDDRDDRVVGAVLFLFRQFPAANGIERVLARAESDVASVFVGHKVPERSFAPRLWDVMIAAMQQRTDVNDAFDARLVNLVRNVMLRSGPDAAKVDVTLRDYDHADAFRDDDFAWMADNIVALEAASPGRWRALMDLFYFASRRLVAREHLLVMGGIALIRSRRVDPGEIRAWVRETASATSAWVLPLESALDEVST